MPNLKDLKTRINSVKSTQKITSAMKMVAAAKLRRAQEAAESGRPYATRMGQVIASLAAKADKESASALLVGRKEIRTHLLVVVSADRGLCGGFNGSIIRAAKNEIASAQASGKQVKLFVVGRKAGDALRSDEAASIFDSLENIQGSGVSYGDAAEISAKIITGFEAGEFDSASLLFNKFVNAITQEVTHRSLIPAEIEEAEEDTGLNASYEYEPEESELLADLLPRNLATQIFSSLLESSAAELAARMTAMDNATRNAGDMIDRLTLVYNRTRQANITKELIEIISGAEAL
jgi:F-type H+-transporting ATPase subunit gamma